MVAGPVPGRGAVEADVACLPAMGRAPSLSVACGSRCVCVCEWVYVCMYVCMRVRKSTTTTTTTTLRVVVAIPTTDAMQWPFLQY